MIQPDSAARTHPTASAGWRRWVWAFALAALLLHLPAPLYVPPTADPPRKLTFTINDVPAYLNGLPAPIRNQASFWEVRFIPDGLIPDPPFRFPRPAALAPAVTFWRDVFTRYTRRQIIIHDDWYLNVIYAVVDLDEGGWKAVREVKQSYTEILEAMAPKWEHPDRMTPEERAIYDRFAEFPEAARFSKRDAAGRVHAQMGQADSIRQGIAFSGRYIGAMRRVFREAGLPVELTCLPVVESAFNPAAVSYVGAAGMWQFMPATARQFGLDVGHPVDERRDPMDATRAAARLLAHNYRTLGSWPLAVTAYNYGLQGMVNAVRQVGGKDIVEIIERFDGPRFNYASRNFYPELLAAVDVYTQYRHFFPEVRLDPPLNLVQVPVPDHVATNALADHLGVPPDRLRDLNPALDASVFKPDGVVPRGYRIALPAEVGDDFAARYAAIPDGMKYAYRPHGKQHRVRRGQALSVIAERYGTSVKALMRLNGLANPRRVRAGQLLKIPGRFVAKADSSAPSAAPPPPKQSVQHRVRRGETLSVIAERYGTSVKALMRLNGLTNPRRVRAGQLLNIPDRFVAKDDSSTPSAASPPPKQSVRHRVRRGQTLSTIARLYNTSARAIAHHNAIRNPQRIIAGQVLRIPEG